MRLGPFGALNNAQITKLTGLYTPMSEWREGEEDFRTLMDDWLAEVEQHLWPAWSSTGWTGGAAADMDQATRDELVMAVRLYHGGDGAVQALDDLPPAAAHSPDQRLRSHLWHYAVEDALVHDRQFDHLKLGPGEEPSFDYTSSRRIGSNYLVYEPGIDIKQFESQFWDRVPKLQPPIFDIKLHFQRPRPWTAAVALDVPGWRWSTADALTHTGIHPSMLSGHCIQGILGGCSVLDAADQELSPARQHALQGYMVDWGDRRVFGGVHYMTDNIASWALARRLIPKLFRNAQQAEDLAVKALTRHSRVFADIVRHFNADSPARRMLLRHFPEGADLA